MILEAWSTKDVFEQPSRGVSERSHRRCTAPDQRDGVGLVEAWQNRMTSPDEDEVQSEPPRNVAADPQPKAQEAPKPDCTGDTAITLVGRSMIRSPDKGREQINGGYRAHLPVTSFLGRSGPLLLSPLERPLPT